MYNELSFDNYDKVYANINSHNIKSINVFTYVGFKNFERNKYVIDIDDLKKWLN